MLRVEEYAEEYRPRLLDISWFMRCLNEYLVREANKEDGCKGRFWEGRYKSQAFLDDAALVACMAYVDLNLIRAKMAKTPETSHYTSVKDRIAKANSGSVRKQHSHLKPLRSRGQFSETAILFTLCSYLELVDWTGRIVRQDKRGHIPVGRLVALKAYAKQTGKQWLHGMYCSQSLYLQ